MTTRLHARALLLCSAALLTCTSATAQEALTLDAISVDSKREVQTGTATAETVVDGEEIADRQAGTVAELVDSAPGVNLINGGSPVGSGINIRGFGANGTYGTDQKVGIFVGGATKGSEELYRIGTQLFTDPLLYREAVVKRGMGGTFEYGSGYFGGLILLEPIHASDLTMGEEGFKLRQTLQFGTNGDGIASSTTAGFQQGNLEILGNFTYRTEGVQVDGAGNDRTTNGYDLPSWLINGRLTFGEADEHQLSLMLSHTQTDETDVPYDSFGTSGGVFGNVDRQTDDKTAVLRYDYDAPDNDFVNLRLELSYSDQQIDQQYVEGSSPYAPVGGYPTTNADHRYQTTKLLAKNTGYLTTGAIDHTLTFGAEFLHRERLDAASAPGGTDKRFAIFASDEIDFRNGLTITPEMRFETQEIGGDSYGTYTNDALMGGVSARYEFGSTGFAVLGGVWYNENLPIIDDLGTPAYMTQPETAMNYEAGIAYDGANLLSEGDALAVKLVGYVTNVRDVTSYSGVEAVDLKGLELEAAYSLASGYYVDLNANVARGTENPGSSTETYWDGIPADQLRVSLGRKWGEELDLSWEVAADARMTRASTETDGSVVHNLRATYRPQAGILEGSEFRFGVENLFDLDYTPHLATRAAPGRNIKFTLTTTF
ncbi:TonB-dependent receptor domain-containing protein [Pseudooceanicola sp. LIPI14-2-Ac024]|uniref:TonB-dependent receptor domain-containing protein n=1 Tax=Pseudooceanicola sp. LIPI14-2-Ac024 TaxID=3344875 RepID=UPI0035D10148